MNRHQAQIESTVNSHFSEIGGSVVYSTKNTLTYLPLQSIPKRWRWLASLAVRNGLPGAFVTHPNYRTFFSALTSFEPADGTRMVETGSSAYGTNSTKLLSRVAQIAGCGFDTIDINPDTSASAGGLLRMQDHAAHCCDSAAFLEQTTDKFCFAYLDSFDLEQGKYQEAAAHGLKEFLALQGKLTPGAVVLVDDTPRSPGIFRSVAGRHQARASLEWLEKHGMMPGKGAMILDWIQRKGQYEILDWGYQVVIRFTG